MTTRIDEEVRRYLLIELLGMLSNTSNNKETDESTFRRFVYYYNKMLENNRDLEPLYGKFRRTHYGPYNEELYNDIKELINQRWIVFNNQKLSLSKNNINSNTKHNDYTDKIINYIKKFPFDTKKLYPLEDMLNVEVGAELP